MHQLVRFHQPWVHDQFLGAKSDYLSLIARDLLFDLQNALMKRRGHDPLDFSCNYLSVFAYFADALAGRDLDLFEREKLRMKGRELETNSQQKRMSRNVRQRVILIATDEVT